MAWVLSNDPDWHAAAQSLIEACTVVDSNEQRVRLLEKLCLDLGENLYPAFLNILCVIAEYGDQKVQSLVAQTLVHALSTGRLPSGKLASWGSRGHVDNLLGQTRSLGPLEYLCAWYAQPSGDSQLSADAFYKIAYKLVSLISVEPKAKALYCAKLRADVNDPIEGALSRPTRQALDEMIQAWENDKSPEDIVSCFQQALHGGGLNHMVCQSAHFPR